MTELKFCRYCSLTSWLEIAKYWELLFNYILTSLISRSKRGWQIICSRGFTSTSPHEALVQCLTVCPRYAALQLDARVCALYRRRLLSHTNGYPSYARNRTYALLSPSPFHYVMAKIVPAVQLAAYGKSSTLYGRSYCRTTKFFRLDGLLLFRIIMRLRCARFARCELRYNESMGVLYLCFSNKLVQFSTVTLHYRSETF